MRVFSPQAPLADVPERELRQAIGLFGFDVLGDWGARARVRRWHTPTTHKDYGQHGNGQHRAHAEHVLAHFLGNTRTCRFTNHTNSRDRRRRATPRRGSKRREEASRDRRCIPLPRLVRDSVYDVRLGRRIPHLDRLARDPTKAERDALAFLLGELAGSHELPFDFELFPHSDRPIRLPLGNYLGLPRYSVPQLDADEMLRWLSWPERATDEQLAAVVAAAKNRRPQKARTSHTRVRMTSWRCCHEAAASTAPGHLTHAQPPCRE
jgi:hypothetical protein